ncbi:uncharacterized protein BYT42DRAFT_116380 [Radiomyces spectabilis]|uniref:uncharacterized protein n=1 Tax=Radiomyces spectabilis TaxID=64574 RepID=UPI00221F6443|nr:uncharacterized protein BYT42DRAFT_116380 [Radiomyces spectabilis]KAI8369620.1 hypothetical protein BYT42DRAFT_116380 [Radiomyces spectabilis]
MAQSPHLRSPLTLIPHAVHPSPGSPSSWLAHHAPAQSPPLSLNPPANYGTQYFDINPHAHSSRSDCMPPRPPTVKSDFSPIRSYTSFSMSQPTTPQPTTDGSLSDYPSPSHLRAQVPETSTDPAPEHDITSKPNEEPIKPPEAKSRQARSTSSRRKRNPFDSDPVAGPLFGATKYKGNIYWRDRQSVLDLTLKGKIEKGFFLADDDWTCYRRNYFQISTSFILQGIDALYDGQDLPCVIKEDGTFHEFQHFVVGISARLADSEKAITLIQHTVKRDKGPQQLPELRTIRPGGDLAFSTVGASQSIVTFERIQFKSATANNGKRRAAQQYFVLVVKLYAKLDDERLVEVASITSSQLVVRGRSPGHYADSANRSTPDATPAPQKKQRNNHPISSMLSPRPPSMVVKSSTPLPAVEYSDLGYHAPLNSPFAPSEPERQPYLNSPFGPSEPEKSVIDSTHARDASSTGYKSYHQRYSSGAPNSRQRTETSASDPYLYTTLHGNGQAPSKPSEFSMYLPLEQLNAPSLHDRWSRIRVASHPSHGSSDGAHSRMSPYLHGDSTLSTNVHLYEHPSMAPYSNQPHTNTDSIPPYPLLDSHRTLTTSHSLPSPGHSSSYQDWHYRNQQVSQARQHYIEHPFEPHSRHHSSNDTH